MLVDIEKQRVLLAFTEGAEVPRAEIKRRIRKAGYDPVDIQVGPGL